MLQYKNFSRYFTCCFFCIILPEKSKLLRVIILLYEIRLKGRQKQGECSAILTMTFIIILLSVFTVNLIPLVYVSAVKPLLTADSDSKIVSLAVSAGVLLMLWYVYGCLSLGCDRFMLKRAENFTAGAGDIFYYFAFSKAFERLKFAVKLFLYKLLMFIGVFAPFSLCAYGCVMLCNQGFSAAVCTIFAVFSAVLFLVGINTYGKISDSLFLVRYRFIRGDYVDFRHLLSQSQQAMVKKSHQLRRLKLSFSGWFLLCLLIIPLPYVWCYYRQTKACFAAEFGRG